MNESTKRLALAISSCEDVCTGYKDSSHPCHKIVNWQTSQWSPKVTDVTGSAMHRPEAWTGDLERAPIIFLASNPSFGLKENFPNWGDKWQDKDIADFGADRFDVEKHKTFGATDGPIFKYADRVLEVDGKMSRRVSHWQWVRRFASLVLNKPLDETSAISDYVMTEMVHCKSFNEIGVPQALRHCTDKWLGKILEISPAKLIFIAGVKPARNFAGIYSDFVPDSWGSWTNPKGKAGKGEWPKSNSDLEERVKAGQWTLDIQKRNSFEMELAGVKRTIVFLARKGGASPNAPWINRDLVHEDLLSYWRSKLID